MFADAALAQRIDGTEARLMATIVSGNTTIEESRRFALPIGEGVASFLRNDSPLNKLIGAGIDAPFDELALGAIEQRYRQHAEPTRIELSTLARPETAAQLTARGYRLLGFENVLGMQLEPRTTVTPSGIHIERVDDPVALMIWCRTLVDGFAMPDATGTPIEHHTREAIEIAVRDGLGATGAARYLAWIDGVPVGAANAYLVDGLAIFGGATTLAPYRRRGVHDALFTARLRDMTEHGADLAIITTAPGSQSMANAMARGFALLYARAVLVRPQ